MSEENPQAQGPPEQPVKPVVRDKRRIDPETGKVREAAPDDAAADDAPAEEQEPEQPQDGALAAAKAEAADLSEQLARRNADLYNLQQEYNGYVRRSKAAASEQRTAGQAEVVEALLGVLDEFELARQHGDLTGPLGATAEKMEGTLAQRFGLERFGAPAEEFDPELHDALMSTPDPEATSTTIAQVMQPGYRMGERVLRAARVAVTSPE
ncbi:molecular chaperone GrpE [Georgenia satyanarayanai]|uniref:Protein GrpE n=1 Tax=Georgenia satyanarayanai TaxID=860221 RepID=A0A2Y9AKX6_9MICO|nr:nucleotide exchange factor GrpE [Georgenia satyanarayanai]PYF98377.1 molecular chaperone GrpE [Georgenia satyanarayanai]SSA44990.1 molecular chaperone GrpE [Georgenia satyanarayanai]